MAVHKLTASRCGSPPPGRTHRRTCIDDAHRRERIGDHRSVHARHHRAVSPTKWASRASGTSRTGAPSITSGEGKDRSGKRCSVRTEPHASRTHPPARNPGHTSRPVRHLPAEDSARLHGASNHRHDDRTNRDRSTGSAATPRERLQCRDRQTADARRTKSAAAEHATHQPEQRAQVHVNETDAHRSRHARPIAGRRTSLVAQRPAPNRRYASPARSRKARQRSPRLARVRRPARRHRAPRCKPVR